MKTQVKVGDVVQVVRGRRNRNPDEPATRGRVLEVDRERGLVWVEGHNMRTRHIKRGRSQKYPQGGRLEREAPVSLSNVMLVTADGVPVRLAKASRAKDGKIVARGGKDGD